MIKQLCIATLVSIPFCAIGMDHQHGIINPMTESQITKNISSLRQQLVAVQLQNIIARTSKTPDIKDDAAKERHINRQLSLLTTALIQEQLRKANFLAKTERR